MTISTLQALLQAPFEHFNTIDSTNSYLLNLSDDNALNGYTCSATVQTHGQGRHSRRWLSPEGGLYLSMLLKPDVEPSEWGLISLIAGIAAAEAIESTTQDLIVNLKWPNDLFINTRKVGGILLQSSLGSSSRVVIGIGINVTSNPDMLPEGRYFHTTTIQKETQNIQSIDQLSQACRILAFKKYLAWLQHPSSVCKQWEKRSLTKNHPIILYTANKQIRGCDRGIDEKGNLKLDTNGRIMRFVSAEVIAVEGTK